MLLVPHSVRPDVLKQSDWWFEPQALRVLAAEYVKFVPAAVRLALCERRRAVAWNGCGIGASSHTEELRLRVVIPRAPDVS